MKSSTHRSIYPSTSKSGSAEVTQPRADLPTINPSSSWKLPNNPNHKGNRHYGTHDAHLPSPLLHHLQRPPRRTFIQRQRNTPAFALRERLGVRLPNQRHPETMALDSRHFFHCTNPRLGISIPKDLRATRENIPDRC